MGEQQVFQPLTQEDKITTVLYRVGIVLSTVIVAVMAILLQMAASSPDSIRISLWADVLLYGLYISVGLSVFFIHLYIGSFKKFLKNLYYVGLAGLAALLYIGKGSLSGTLA